MTYSAWKEGDVDNQCACGGRVCVHRYQLESLEIILRSHSLEKWFHLSKGKKFWKCSFKQSIAGIFIMRLSESLDANVIMNFS